MGDKSTKYTGQVTQFSVRKLHLVNSIFVRDFFLGFKTSPAVGTSSFALMWHVIFLYISRMTCALQPGLPSLKAVRENENNSLNDVSPHSSL